MQITKYFTTIILLIFSPALNCQSVSHNNDADDIGTIIFASILFRHGDRTPIEPYPTDPYRNETDWPVPWGQLTKIGMHQHLMLGRWLRNRYNHFLPAHYSPYDIFIRSSDYGRTLMSAEANLAGLYPPKADQLWDIKEWMPIPIHTIPPKIDDLLSGKRPCARYDYEYEKLMNSTTFVKIHQRYLKFYNYLSNYSGKKISTIIELEYLYNVLYIENLYNKTLPTWTKTVFPNKFLPLVNLSFTLAAYNKILQRLKIGPLIGDMVNNMIMKSRGLLMPDRKIWMYSAHDETIANLLMALNVFQPHSPPYAAAVLVELRKNLNNQYLVTISYKNSTDKPTIFTLPGCQTACPLEDFVRLTEDIIPKDLDKECSMNANEDNVEVNVSILIVILISAILIMSMLIILILTVAYSHYKRNYTQYYFRLSTEPF